MYKVTISFFLVFLLSACSSPYPNQNPVNKMFPSVSGKTLNEMPIDMPEFFKGQKTLLLLGYKHKSQFDIDRWLIGLDMTNTQVPVFEIPAIKGFFPGLVAGFIDEGMRKGIPEELWSIVVTVYEGGDELQKFTGNTEPKRARVILLDEAGKVIHFYDRGFSVDALNAVRAKL